MRRGALAAEWLDAVLGGADAAILPVFPVPVHAIAAAIGRLPRTTRALNHPGPPAVTIPVGSCAAGLPITARIVGRPWSEPLLLRIADTVQHTSDFHCRRPEAQP